MTATVVDFARARRRLRRESALEEPCVTCAHRFDEHSGVGPDGSMTFLYACAEPGCVCVAYVDPLGILAADAPRG